jgi:predicted nucleic acid-binding protein
MAPPVRGKVLLDTNIFIDYLRSGLHAEWVAVPVEGTVRFLSAVVLLELQLGADTPRRRRAVARLKAAFPAPRFLAPGPSGYERAGELFRRIHGSGDRMVDRLGAINDLLIAITAWQIGATVVTLNAGDFRRIAAELRGLRWIAPS